MTQLRPFRFGTSQPVTTRSQLLAQVRNVQDLGFSTFVATDHVGRMAGISTLAAVAALDTSLRLTSIVFANDFRHPALLANEAATIDIISDGRLELGIGTGWAFLDYEKLGIPFDSAGVRVDRLTEAIAILKGLFADDALTYHGRYYTINDYDMQPKPVQRPHPPILIGGGGKRMLSLAGREADIVSINPITTDGGMDLSTMTAEIYAQKVAWVRDAAADRFAEIELHALLFSVIETDDQEQAAKQWIQQWDKNILRRGESIATGAKAFTVEAVLASPYLLIGTIDQMVAQLQARRQAYGISYFTTSSGVSADTFAPIVAQLAGK